MSLDHEDIRRDEEGVSCVQPVPARRGAKIVQPDLGHLQMSIKPMILGRKKQQEFKIKIKVRYLHNCIMMVVGKCRCRLQ